MAATTKKMVGKYKILSKIGQGGMGAVFKAYHPTLKRVIIIKQLTIRKNAMAIERFKREAAIMLDFRDERIVQVYDHFKEGASYYIAMEYVEGVGLDRLIEEKRYLSNEAAVLIITEICRGLKYAHDRGVVHRDIKPENILISRTGQVKLTDFGIAKSDSDQGSAGLTKAGTTLGSPAYMSPEQIFNTKGVDKRADIYSLGVMLYKMITGKLPYPRDMSPNTIIQIQKGRYVKPSKLNPAIRPRLQQVITRAMQPSRKKRYSDLKEILFTFRGQTGGFKDKKSIDEAIRNYIKGKEIKLKSINPLFKSSLALFSSAKVKIAGAAAALVLLVMISHYTGLIYKVLLPSYFNKVQMSLLIPEEVKEPGKKAAFILFRKNSRGLYKKVLFPLPAFSGSTGSGEKRSCYLAHGEYRIDMLFHGITVQKHLRVLPYRATGGSPMEVVYDTAGKMTIPVQLDFDYTDQLTLLALEGVEVFIWDKKWINFNLYKKTQWRKITAGAAYKFQFKKEGYKTDYRTITIPAYHSVAGIAVALEPETGKLTLTSHDTSCKVSLNFSRYCYSGQDEKKVIFLGQTGPQALFSLIKKITDPDSADYAVFTKTLHLVPGEYEVTIKKGKTIEYRKIVLKKEQTQSVTIDFKKETKKILVTMN